MSAHTHCTCRVAWHLLLPHEGSCPQSSPDRDRSLADHVRWFTGTKDLNDISMADYSDGALDFAYGKNMSDNNALEFAHRACERHFSR
jgi:hypothetical protein